MSFCFEIGNIANRIGKHSNTGDFGWIGIMSHSGVVGLSSIGPLAECEPPMGVLIVFARPPTPIGCFLFSLPPTSYHARYTSHEVIIDDAQIAWFEDVLEKVSCGYSGTVLTLCPVRGRLGKGIMWYSGTVPTLRPHVPFEGVSKKGATGPAARTWPSEGPWGICVNDRRRGRPGLGDSPGLRSPTSRKQRDFGVGGTARLLRLRTPTLLAAVPSRSFWPRLKP